MKIGMGLSVLGCGWEDVCEEDGGDDGDGDGDGDEEVVEGGRRCRLLLQKMVGGQSGCWSLKMRMNARVSFSFDFAFAFAFSSSFPSSWFSWSCVFTPARTS